MNTNEEMKNKTQKEQEMFWSDELQEYLPRFITKPLPMLENCELEYELDPETLIYYPILKGPKPREEQSLTAQRAIDRLEELDSTALDMANMSGLTDRIFEEIAERVDNKEEELRKLLTKNNPLRENWQENYMTQIDIEKECRLEGNLLMDALLKELIEATTKVQKTSELESWQLPA